MKPEGPIDELRRTLLRLGVHPRRWRGQNFLLDRTVVADAVRAANVQPKESVLEVGPGLGVLTDALVQTGANVTAVELEPRFATYLRQRFRTASNLTVLAENLFAVNLAERFPDLGYAVVANLPYSVTGLALRNFLSGSPRPDRMVLLLQREVAERLMFRPGEGSVLGLLTAATARVEMVRIVPPTAFFPEPAVTSALVRLALYRESVRTRLGIELGALLRVARIGFAARRKTLANNLAAGLGQNRSEIEGFLAGIALETNRRAQELTLPEWAKLARSVVEKFIDPAVQK